MGSQIILKKREHGREEEREERGCNTVGPLFKKNNKTNNFALEVDSSLKTKGTLPPVIGPVFDNVWEGNLQTYFAELCLPYVLGLSVVRNTRDENF